jgi:hypothetical protein
VQRLQQESNYYEMSLDGLKTVVWSFSGGDREQGSVQEWVELWGTPLIPANGRVNVT